MNISNIITSASLALAIFGGAMAIAPSSAHAGGKSTFISYDALKKNRVPCSKKGASASNCKPGGQANPYQRGCSDISRCKRN